MKMSILGSLGLGCLLLTTPVDSADPTGEEIMQKTFEVMKLDGSEALATLNIYSQNNEKRERKMAIVSKNMEGVEKRLVRFVAPGDVKDTGFLSYDYVSKADEMWLYLPSLRKTRRIAATDKSQSFMGSEFSYADFNPPNAGDFNHKILRTEALDGVTCWIIESIAKTPVIASSVGYSKRVSYVSQKDFTAKKSSYFDTNGVESKVLTVKKMQEVDTIKHRFHPMIIEIVNLQNKRRSEFIVEKIQFKPDVPEDYFTTRYLERS